MEPQLWYPGSKSTLTKHRCSAILFVLLIINIIHKVQLAPITSNLTNGNQPHPGIGYNITHGASDLNYKENRKDSNSKGNESVDLHTTLGIVAGYVSAIATVIAVIASIWQIRKEGKCCFSGNHTSNRDERSPLKNTDEDSSIIAAKRKLVEATRNCYIDRCRQVPRKPWIKGDFTHIDKIFIDPSLVKRNNSGNEGHEATYRDYREMLQDTSITSKRYVIVGTQGMGKTTLCQKITHDWAIGHDNMKQFECVFLVKAWRCHNKEHSILDQIFIHYISEDQRNDEEMKDALNSLLQSSKTLLIIDGLDEMDNTTQVDEIMKMVLRKNYPSLSIIISTRPHSLLFLHSAPQIADSQYYISGFHKNDVIKYVGRYFEMDVMEELITMEMYRKYKYKDTDCNIRKYGFRQTEDGPYDEIVTESIHHLKLEEIISTEDARKLFSIIEAIENKKLWHLAQNPLCCLFICFIWEKLNYLPDKVAQIYQQLVTVFAQIYKGRRKGKNDSAKSWEEIFDKIGELAFDMLFSEQEEDKLVFDECTVVKYLDPELACQIGLLTSVDSSKSRIADLSNLIESTLTAWYSFIHKSIQEFCAAHYVYKHSINNEHSAALHKVQSSMQNKNDILSAHLFLHFICGLGDAGKPGQNTAGSVLLTHCGDILCENIQGEEDEWDHEYSELCRRQLDCWGESLNKTTNKSSINVDFMKLLYESSSSIDDYVNYLQVIHGVENILNIPRTQLRYLHIDEEVIKRIHSNESKCSYEDFDSKVQRNISLGVKPASKMLTSCIVSKSPDLRYLNLVYNSVPDAGLALVTAGCRQIQVIKLKRCKLSCESIACMINFMPEWQNLVEFNISENYQNDATWKSQKETDTQPNNYSVTYSTCYSLQVLDINGCNIPAAILKPLLKVVALSPDLSQCILSNNKLGNGVINLAKTLSVSTEVLQLSNCDLSSQGLSSIFGNIARWKKLTKLDLSNNFLTQDEDTEVWQQLVATLRRNRCKAEIDVTQCGISEDILKSLWDCRASVYVRESFY